MAFACLRVSFQATVALAALTAGGVKGEASPPNSADNPLRLWQAEPGVTFNDSFLIGNGRLGFSLPGDALSETIVLNEDSYWSGGKLDRVNPDAATFMPEIQQLVQQGEIEEASRLASFAYMGTPLSVRHYDWLGNLVISMRGAEGEVEDYERWLDLGDATAGVYYSVDGVEYTREYVASYPNDVIAVRISASGGGKVSFDANMVRGQDWNRFSDFSGRNGDDTIFFGSGSDGADPITYVAGVKATVSGGSLRTIGEYIIVDGADEATLYFTAWTSYRKESLREAVFENLDAAAQKTFDEIRSDHVEDYKKLFNTVDLSLGQSSDAQKEMSTADRFAALTETFDPELAVLYFYFGRYLLIASGREGTMAANLQGIWNKDRSPQWGSKYTININTEMNYWPSMVTNMPSLHQSMFDLIESMHKSGLETAKKMYNASGSMAHHNTDIWGDTAPQDNWPGSSVWPGGLAWMATHIYEHYLFTGDKDILEKYYPVLRDSAIFFLDFLTEYQGYLVTNPSVSPEILYYLPNSTIEAALSPGPTSDNSIIWELFGMVLESQRVLGQEDETLASRIEETRARLPPLRKNQFGGIAEWMHDFEENEPEHRHFSQLFGLFPGSQITSANTTTFEAARSSLRRRLDSGGGDVGWSRAWAIALEARLFNASGVAESFNHLLINLTYPSSLLDINEPSAFQLDGNYGGTATVIEALVQSHELVSESGNGTVASAAYVGDGSTTNLIRLLPALPDLWAANGGGHATGLLARGGFELDIFWDEEARLTSATLKSLKGNTAWITLGQGLIGTSNSTTISVEGHGQGPFVKLETEAGETYAVKRQ